MPAARNVLFLPKLAVSVMFYALYFLRREFLVSIGILIAVELVRVVYGLFPTPNLVNVFTKEKKLRSILASLSKVNIFT